MSTPLARTSKPLRLSPVVHSLSVFFFPEVVLLWDRSFCRLIKRNPFCLHLPRLSNINITSAVSLLPSVERESFCSCAFEVLPQRLILFCQLLCSRWRRLCAAFGKSNGSQSLFWQPSGSFQCWTGAGEQPRTCPRCYLQHMHFLNTAANGKLDKFKNPDKMMLTLPKHIFHLISVSENTTGLETFLTFIFLKHIALILRVNQAQEMYLFDSNKAVMLGFQSIFVCGE